MNKPLEPFADAVVMRDAEMLKQVALQSLIQLFAKVCPHHRMKYEDHVAEMTRIYLHPGNTREEPANFGANAKFLHDRLDLEANKGVRFPESMDCLELRSGNVKAHDLVILRRGQYRDFSLWSAQAGIVIDKSFNAHTVFHGIGPALKA